ncbi:hypothetical protein [Nesterenkonia populi]|uniref:hypothetical protein n=1 Tax=Nesterenkonia populi TaxID=1591087 RepID=UPI0011BE8238|nr:hypothetical protein [Nesterenkonia populi]
MDDEPAPSTSETTEAVAEATAEPSDADDSSADQPEADATWYEPEGGMVYTQIDGEVEAIPIEEIEDFDPADYEQMRGEEVSHLECADSAALADKSENNADRDQPVGWPQEWDGTGAMPDPYCHPDYLEIGEWEHLEAHSACWEGDETSTLWRTFQTDDEVNAYLWKQSQARADWPGYEGTCEEQWAQHEYAD